MLQIASWIPLQNAQPIIPHTRVDIRFRIVIVSRGETNMTTHRDNYRSWCADLLPRLYPDRNAGFAILTVAFPLLERYLRQRAGPTPKDDSNDNCMNELCTLFLYPRSGNICQL